ncbi:F0F1 ATP synthase subunit gamma [Desulfonema ishimotonii]|uniref:F0F1 ATP synthase subunit gamma n=1 Tax=Desulfonema ishimotonii TaxID=45657 RepID=A0A401FX12_9BACT|nr:F0F1 ATP synthase subunit gamma [Desulfonema ishimotonii]GBC61496.1 F0F1 ATP synthase subunit gamma [Desulfonema ishimotonii]
MQSLENLKKKIKTAQDLLSVVRTMKSLAAVNIRQLEEAVASLEEYSRTVALGWQALFRSHDRLAPAARADSQEICLVFGSDQGMCGGFNEAIAETALAHAGQRTSEDVKTVFWTVGERVRGGIEDGGGVVREHFHLPGGLAGITGQVGEMVQGFEAWQRESGGETLRLFFNRLIRGRGYEPGMSRILPLDAAWQERYRKEKWPGRCLPLPGLSHTDIFRHLFREHLFISFYQAFAQSMASENAARLRAMQAAEKNIGELEADLQGEFRETRQNTITAELLDIISGFEAISEED